MKTHLYQRIAARPEFRAAVLDGVVSRAALRLTIPDVECGGTVLGKARDYAEKSLTQDAVNMEVGLQRQEETRFEDAGQTGSLFSKSTRITSLQELIEHCKIDLIEWGIERHIVNKWEVGARNDEGQIAVEPLFQIKVWLKRRNEVIAARDEIDRMIAEAKKKMPVYKPIARPKKQTGHLAEISIYDPHFGKLAWNPETRGGDYDVDIAERIFETALEDLIQKTSIYGISRILFPLGNDLLNVDNNENTTTKGTPQSVDGRFQRTFTKVRQLAIRSIERLREIAPVDVVIVPGNHDQLSCFHLGDSLQMRFENCKDVSIDNSPPLRKYYEWGLNMFLLTHGNKKVDKLGSVASNEMPEMWGRTRYRESHVGHFHRVGLIEEFGFRTRFMPSLSAADVWHTESGFVGNIRSAEALVWCKENGLIGTSVFNLPKGQ